jgi:hypothetical protein
LFEIYVERTNTRLDLVHRYFALWQVKITDRRRQRVLFIAGRRRAESKRRNNIPLMETDGTAIWASPLAMWTKEDMGVYRAISARDGDPVPFNSVSDALGMSGECLCGAFAQEGELERIRLWFPDTAAEIDQLRQAVEADPAVEITIDLVNKRVRSSTGLDFPLNIAESARDALVAGRWDPIQELLDRESEITAKAKELHYA